jgi:hypothetical protein
MSERERGVSTTEAVRRHADYGEHLSVAAIEAILAALEDAALLDALERSGAALLPVEGNIMPAGTWCVDPPGAAAEDMGAGVRGALRAAFSDAAPAADTGGEA